jgi:hypothetical protein
MKDYVLSLIDAAGNDGLSSTDLFELDPKRFHNVEQASSHFSSLWKAHDIIRVAEHKTCGYGLRYRYYCLTSSKGLQIATEMARYDAHAQRALQKYKERAAKPKHVIKKTSAPVAKPAKPTTIAVRVERQVKITIDLGQGDARTISEESAKELYHALHKLLG